MYPSAGYEPDFSLPDWTFHDCWIIESLFFVIYDDRNTTREFGLMSICHVTTEHLRSPPSSLSPPRSYEIARKLNEAEHSPGECQRVEGREVSFINVLF